MMYALKTSMIIEEYQKLHLKKWKMPRRIKRVGLMGLI